MAMTRKPYVSGYQDKEKMDLMDQDMKEMDHREEICVEKQEELEERTIYGVNNQEMCDIEQRSMENMDELKEEE